MPRLFRRLTLSLLAASLLVLAAPLLAQAQTHVVQPGENLFRIALSYGLTTTELASANSISDPTRIFVGQVLTIPIPGAAPSAPAEVAVIDVPSAPASTATHVVVHGEKLGDIARRYGMTVSELTALNNIANPNLIYVGQVLTVHSSAPVANVEPSAPAVPPASAPQTTHVVQSGEYLSQIAARYGVSWVAVAQANNIVSPDRVFAGTVLTIPAPGTVAIASTTFDNAVAPTAPIGVGREILVDISDSRIYAYENGVLMRTTLGSMGRAATPTIIGTFTVQRKYVTSDMSGPGYYLSGVPYTMYFYQGYAIHGTYWHTNWGTPMSRGCVNLPPSEAEWYFNFAPVGTPVNVQA